MDPRLTIRRLMMTFFALAVLWSCHVPAAFCKPPDLRVILQQTSQAAGEIESSWNQIDILIKLADVYSEMGDQTEAEAALARSLMRASAMEDRHRIGALRTIAKAQGRMGKVDEATATLHEALQIEDPSHQEIISIVDTFAKLGDVPAALSAAESIEDTHVKDYALRTIALVQTGSGQFEAASQIADLAKGKVTKMYIMFAIAVEHVWAGQIEEARKIAIPFEDEPIYVVFLARVAEAQAKAGDRDAAARTIEAALRAASLIETEEDHLEFVHDVFALKQIVGAQTVLGDLAGAFKTASLVRVPANKSICLLRIAEIQVAMGDFKGALETTNAVDEARVMGGIDSIQYAVGLGQVRAGDIRGALETVDLMQDDDWKDQVLDAIAVAQAKSGDWASATATFARARTDRNFPQELRTDGLTEMAEALATRGEVQMAYQWAMNHKTSRARALALIGVAKGMLRNR